MRKKFVQVSLLDACKDVAASLEEYKPKFIRMLDEHIDWDTIIPARFYTASLFHSLDFFFDYIKKKIRMETEKLHKYIDFLYDYYWRSVVVKVEELRQISYNYRARD